MTIKGIFMDVSYVRKVIEHSYSLKVNEIEKKRGSYKIICDDRCYALKVVKYDFAHFYFIFSAINHLKTRGFNTIPKIINTKDNLGYINLNGYNAYLNEWIDSRNCDYKDLNELSKAAEKLATLHKCSENFTLNKNMKPRIGWYSWIKVFETRCLEILDFKNRLYQKAYKSQFDSIFLNSIEEELDRGKKAIDELKNNRYIEIMDKEVLKRGFCHHDYANHNVLVDKSSELNIIDFDYCILDSHLHDLASLLIRSMKDGNWSDEVGRTILNSYSKNYDIYDEELKLIKAFIRFPQSFWQIGLQYYWEQQPWGEEFLVNKLNKYLKDRNQRENFLDNFFN